MKKSIAFLTIILSLTLAGCRQNQTKDVESQKIYFQGTVIEIGENYLLVEPVEEAEERKSSDRIDIATETISEEKSVEYLSGARAGDLIEIGYGGEIAESDPAQIRDAFSLRLVERDAPENTACKWGVTFLAENVTPSGLTLVCRQSGGEVSGSLSTGSPYVVLALRDGQWAEADKKIDEVAWTMEAWSIPDGSSVRWEVNWEWLYGSLPAGRYMIGKQVMDLREPGDYDSEMCYAEFVIEE